MTYLSEGIRDSDVKFWQHFLSFKSSIFVIKIWDRYFWYFKNYAFFSNVEISLISSSIFIVTFEWNGNFELWWFHRKDLVLIYCYIPYFKLKKIYLLKSILGGKLKMYTLRFLFKWIPKFIDYITSDDWIRKTTSKFIGL